MHNCLLKGVLQVHEVFPEGAAALDGRLQPGDRILSVNDYSLTGLPFNFAVSKLASAFSGLPQIASSMDLSTVAMTTAPTSPSHHLPQGNTLFPHHPASDSITLVVERPGVVQLKWYDQEVIVELMRKPGRGLGICLAQRTALRRRKSGVAIGSPPIITPNGIQKSATQQPELILPEEAPLGVIISDLVGLPISSKEIYQEKIFLLS